MASTLSIRDKLLLLFLFIIFIAFRCSELTPNFLTWDVFGYYLYLPAQFLYHDLAISDFSWLNQLKEQYEVSSTLYQLTLAETGNHIIKYSMGLAFLWSPFFFLGHLIAYLLGYPMDGLSEPYQYSILASGILIALIGLFYQLKILKTFFSDKTAYACLILLFFGTNYFQLNVFDGTLLTHNFLFTFYAILIFYTIEFAKEQTNKNTIFIGCSVGIITLIRPSEAVSILIPILWNIQLLCSKGFLQNKWKHLLLAAFLIGLFFLPQVLYWKNFAGEFLFFSYTNAGEGLDFLNPHILSFLFSFKKGWIIYTPLSLFFIWGIVELFKKNRQLFWVVFIFLIVDVYIISSWTNWWYAGGSFSSRSIVPAYALLVIPLGYFIQKMFLLRKVIKVLIIILLIGIVSLNLFHSWQFREGILKRERMTAAYYFASFGKTKVDQHLDDLLSIKRDDGLYQNVDKMNYSTRLLYDQPFDHKGKNKFITEGKMILSPKNQYTPEFRIKYNTLTNKDHIVVTSSARISVKNEQDYKNIYMVTYLLHKGKPYKYAAYPLSQREKIQKEGNLFRRSYLTPYLRSEEDELSAYVWYTGDGEIAVEHFTVEGHFPIKKKSFFDEFKNYD